MKIKNIILMSAIAASLVTLSSCNSDDNIEFFSTGININAPVTINGKTFNWKEGNIVFKEINTNVETIIELPLTTQPQLQAGQYNVSLEGSIEYNTDGFDEDGNPTILTSISNVRGSKENITVNSNGVSIDIDLMIYNNESSFIFEEIFITGSLNAAGTSGILGDKYFKIYNNSNSIQYADGLSLLESVITTVDNFTYSPDFRQEGMGTQVIYTIPGNGKDYPVNPGESLIIADQASNHSIDNTNALDMSNADFEWYDYTDKGTDTDNPEITNLDRWYSYSASIWTPSNQGNRAYGIARIPVDKETFLKTDGDYYHTDWSYVNSGKVLYKKGYLIKNEWILDAVNIAPSTTFNKLAVSVAIDKSYVSISSIGSDATRFGKSIQRKISGKMKDENGNTYTVLLDTDDSANDFNVTTASLK